MKRRKIIDEFKTFIARGSVVDLACGVIMGSAFTAITNSMVKDIITPLAGFLMRGTDFSGFKIVLRHASDTSAELAITYGNFINAVINFFIVAIVAFFIVKAFNRINEKVRRDEIAKKKLEDEKKKKDAEEKEALYRQRENEKASLLEERNRVQVELLTEIRDLLRNEKKDA